MRSEKCLNFEEADTILDFRRSSSRATGECTQRIAEVSVQSSTIQGEGAPLLINQLTLTCEILNANSAIGFGCSRQSIQDAED